MFFAGPRPQAAVIAHTAPGNICQLINDLNGRYLNRGPRFLIKFQAEWQKNQFVAAASMRS
jgi:hypothetical protein